MRALTILLAYFAWVFIGAALLAPWIHALVQSAAGSFEFLKPLADQSFHRYLSRTIQVFAVLGLWIFIRETGIKLNESAETARTTKRWRNLGIGFLLALSSVALVAIVLGLAGVRAFDSSHSAADIGSHFLKATLAAALVAVFEEFLFRGVLFTWLRQTTSLMPALIGSSGIYALLHFMQSPQHTGAVTWSTGLTMLPALLGFFSDTKVLLPAGLSLFIVGTILAQAFHRSGTLHFSIGLHAGWILWGKSYGFFTRGTGGENHAFWGSGKLIDGWFLVPVLCLVFWCVTRIRFAATDTKSTDAARNAQ